MKGRGASHETRDEVVDFVRRWSDKTELPQSRLVGWIGVGASKFHDWKLRFGRVNEHNAWGPRDHWLSADEWERIVEFARQNPLEEYRRLTYMMLDADVVACSPASVYRFLKNAGLLAGCTPVPTKKGTGFVQPLAPHVHWNVDVSYLNLAGTFYWFIRPKRAREAYPDARPRFISDNGPQFLAEEFKEFMRLAGMTHVRTSPHYPQSNGRIERWHKTPKQDCIRPFVPLSLDDARRLVANFAQHYNPVRLQSALGYITPYGKQFGQDQAIHDARDRKLAEARQRSRCRRQSAEQPPSEPSAALLPPRPRRRPQRADRSNSPPSDA
ncbi:MAG: integrase core domain-containing protein [Pirellulales bacterium]